MTPSTPGWAAPTPPHPRVAPTPAARPPGGAWAYQAHAPARSPRVYERPSYREPHRCTPLGVMGGAAVAAVWFIVTALLGADLASTMWVVASASLLAWGGVAVLARYGDRGAAAGVAAVSGAALAVVGLVVQWNLLGDSWILW